MRQKYYYIIIVVWELLTDAMGILLYYHGILVTITESMGIFLYYHGNTGNIPQRSGRESQKGIEQFQ
jgi:hypothetical protein